MDISLASCITCLCLCSCLWSVTVVNWTSRRLLLTFFVISVWVFTVKILIVMKKFLLCTHTFPRNYSCSFEHSKIPDFNCVLLPVASCNNWQTIVSKCNSVTTNVRSPYRMHRTTVSEIVNLNCIIPSSTYNHIWIDWGKLCTENSVWVSRHFSSRLHFEGKWLCSFIENLNMTVFTTNS